MAKSKEKLSIYEEVTNHIVEALQAGLDSGSLSVPWERMGSLPRNGVSQRPYTGINPFLLHMASSINGFASNEWFSYKQAQHLGGTVRKGSKSTSIIFCKMIKKTVENANGEKEVVKFPVFRRFPMFNRDQIDGLPEQEIEIVNEDERNADMDMFISNTGADISFGSTRACYIPSLDKINVPHFEHFHNEESYYSTMFHELAHWTGHNSRLNRDLGGSFGNPDYAKEELVAELTAAFLCAEHGIEGELQHAEYISHWIKVLKNDNKFIFKAARLAQDAANFLNGLNENINSENYEEAAEKA